MRTIESIPKYFLCSLSSQAVRKIAAYYNHGFEPLGLTVAQVMAMRVLWLYDHMSLGKFAAHSGIGKAAAVTMIQRLEAMGLVIRKPHPTDARLNVLCLTDKAISMVPELLKVATELETSLEKIMGEENLAALTKGLNAICELDLDGLADE